MKIKIKLIRNAFTLIELLVVVAIIGILATVVIINVSGAKASSRYVKTVAEMSEISKATLQYKAEHNGVWPKEWSGYNDWAHACDPTPACTHKFYNGLDSSDPLTYNDFLVDYMGGIRFKPDCPAASYSFYNYGGTQLIYYTPKPGFNYAPTFTITGDNTRVNILNKTNKKITCQEDDTTEFN